jgi:hypothetical protein
MLSTLLFCIIFLFVIVPLLRQLRHVSILLNQYTYNFTKIVILTTYPLFFGSINYLHYVLLFIVVFNVCYYSVYMLICSSFCDEIVLGCWSNEQIKLLKY